MVTFWANLGYFLIISGHTAPNHHRLPLHESLFNLVFHSSVKSVPSTFLANLPPPPHVNAILTVFSFCFIITFVGCCWARLTGCPLFSLSRQNHLFWHLLVTHVLRPATRRVEASASLKTSLEQRHLTMEGRMSLQIHA